MYWNLISLRLKDHPGDCLIHHHLSAGGRQSSALPMCRDDFVYGPSQWETTLHCNVVSHWVGPKTKWNHLTSPAPIKQSSGHPFCFSVTIMFLFCREQSGIPSDGAFLYINNPVCQARNLRKAAAPSLTNSRCQDHGSLFCITGPLYCKTTGLLASPHRGSVMLSFQDFIA